MHDAWIFPYLFICNFMVTTTMTCSNASLTKSRRQQRFVSNLYCKDTTFTSEAVYKLFFCASSCRVWHFDMDESKL